MTKILVFLDGTQVDEVKLDQGKEYLLGRGTMCDIVLDHPKISRQHAKISFSDNLWHCRVLSRFGNVLVNGHQVDNFSLTDKVKITIPPYEVQFVDSAGAQKSKKTAAPQSHDEAVAAPPMDDKTQVGSLQLKGLLIREGDEHQEIQLGLEKVTAGRSQVCEIKLSDTQASRRHFTIEFDGHSFVLTDLNSANKTFVNGEEITKHVLEPGDVIMVGAEQLRFELVHPDFEHLPALIPPKAPLKSALSPTGNNKAVIKVMPGQVTPGAYATIPKREWFSYTQIQHMVKDPKFKTKAALAVIVIVIVFQVFSGKKEDGRNAGNITMNSQQQDKVYDRLTPEQQKFIDDTYNLSMNLYTSGRYDMAAIEVEKIFKYVSDYKGARNLYDSCRQARAIQKEQDEQNRMKAERAELQRKVTETLDHCEDLLKSAKYGDVEGCVSQIENLDPDNERGRNLVLDAKQKQAAQEANSEYRSAQVRKKTLAQQTFKTAEKHYKEKNFFPALKEFETVRKLAFVDSEHLKEKAEVGIKSAKAELMKQSAALVQEGKASLDQKDYGTALQKFAQAMKIYPGNGDAADYYDQTARELHSEMKNLYSESVIEENLGNIDSAKKKWHTIIKNDDKNDSYYNKAQIKLRRYDK